MAEEKVVKTTPAEGESEAVDYGPQIFAFGLGDPNEDLINLLVSENPKLKGVFTTATVKFGEPAVITPSKENGWKNTAINVFPKGDSELLGYTEVYYNRVDLCKYRTSKTDPTMTTFTADVQNVDWYGVLLTETSKGGNYCYIDSSSSIKSHYDETMKLLPIKGVYSALPKLNPEGWPVDFESISYVGVDSTVTATVAATSLRYVPKSYYRMAIKLGKISADTLFTNRNLKPFIGEKGLEINPTLYSWEPNIHNLYTVEAYKAGKKSHMCCNFGVDLTGILDTKKEFYDKLDKGDAELAKRVNQVLEMQNMPKLPPAGYANQRTFNDVCTISSRCGFAFPILDGHRVALYAITTTAGDGYTSVKPIDDKGTMLFDDKEWFDECMYTTGSLSEVWHQYLGTIVLPFYYKG